MKTSQLIPQPEQTAQLLRDTPGAAWEKRGNSLWLGCSCKTWFPVSVALTRPGAPPAICPNCHQSLPLV